MSSLTPPKKGEGGGAQHVLAILEGGGGTQSFELVFMQKFEV